MYLFARSIAKNINVDGNDAVSMPAPILPGASDNHLYIYSQIKKDTMLTFIQSLRAARETSLMRVQAFDLKEAPPIYVHINSYGGLVDDGVAAMDAVLEVRQDVPIITIVEGCVASAATFISIVGSERIMMPHATMMIHQLSGGFFGKFEDMKEEIVNCELIMKTIKKIYKEHSKIKMKELDEILKHDLLWTPEQCLGKGLIDSIVGR